MQVQPPRHEKNKAERKHKPLDLQQKVITTAGIQAYPLAETSGGIIQGMEENSKPSPKKEKKMSVTCKNCNKDFDSTFSVDDFQALSKDQYEAGTLHLCPYCGSLTIYKLQDYHEPKP